MTTGVVCVYGNPLTPLERDAIAGFTNSGDGRLVALDCS
jgi:hypothetical protein